MTVEFNSAKNGADLKYVFDQVIPLYIRSFGAFFAAVEDMDVLAEEEDELWKSSDEERMQVRARSGPRRQELPSHQATELLGQRTVQQLLLTYARAGGRHAQRPRRPCECPGGGRLYCCLVRPADLGAGASNYSCIDALAEEAL